MSKYVYCLHDAKNNSFSFFGFFKSNSEAQRTLAVNILRSPDIMPAMFPGDFTLFAVATFNDSGKEMPFKSFQTLDNCGTIAQILSEFKPTSVSVPAAEQTVEKPLENA